MTGPITRRRFIQHAVVGASAVASVASIDHRRAWAAPLAQDSSGTVQPGGTLTYAMTEQVGGIDPHVSSNLYSQWIFEHIYDQLLRRDRDGNLIPGLATSWELPDPTTYTFKLRQGVMWHHGREFNADDVKFSIERQADPNVAGMNQSIYLNVASVEVTDPYSVTIKLKQPFAPFINYLSAPRSGNIVAADFTQQAGNDLKTTASGTGPFKLVEYVAATHTKLARNPDYWEEGVPHLDELVFQYIAEEQSRVAALRTDAVNMANIGSIPILTPLRSDASLAILQTAPLITTHMMINNGVEPLTDVRVRQALSLAIDRQEMMETLTLGEGALSSYLPPGDPFYAVPDPAALPNYQRDVDRARQLLAEAGFADGFKLTLKIGPAATYTTMAEMIQSYLKEAGIELEIVRLEQATWVEDFWNVNHEMLLMGFQSTIDPDELLFKTMHSESTDSWTNVKSADLDALLEQGRTTQEPEARQQIYRDIQTMIADQAFEIILFANAGSADVAKTNVQGMWEMDKTLSHAAQFREGGLG
jgi:peptide/nickel transport system substrate-binding protein